MIDVVSSCIGASFLFAWLSLSNRRIGLSANNKADRKMQEAISFGFFLLSLLFVDASLASAYNSITINEAYYSLTTGISAIKGVIGAGLIIVSILWVFLFIIYFLAYLLDSVRVIYGIVSGARNNYKRRGRG